MKTIKVEDNQILLDIALQYYGTAEAISEILTNNPNIKNDPQSLQETGRNEANFYPDLKLKVGQTLQINDDSRTIIKNIVKKITNNITTYNAQPWQEQ